MQQSPMLLTPREPSRAPRPGFAPRLRRALQVAGALGLVAFAVALSTSSSTGCSSFCDGRLRPRRDGDGPGRLRGPLRAVGVRTRTTSAWTTAAPSSAPRTATAPSARRAACAASTDSGEATTVCASTDLAAIGTKCPFGNECKTLTACPDGKACDFTQCDGGACTQDKTACSTGEAGPSASCNAGLCPDGKTACVVPGCAQADCNPLSCVTDGTATPTRSARSSTATRDTDCAAGYWCGTVRDPARRSAAPARRSATTSSAARRTDPCVDPTGRRRDGHDLRRGGQFCPSATAAPSAATARRARADLDCSLVAGQHCTRWAARRCAPPTAGPTPTACTDHKCVSGACVEKFGACKGTGKFCEPCLNDLDCGGKGSGTVCVGLGAGQRACFPTSTRQLHHERRLPHDAGRAPRATA